MRTVEVKIPDLLFNQAQELAARENIALDQILAMALSQALGIWCTGSQNPTSARVSDRQKFLEKLQRALEAGTSTGKRKPAEIV
jgi:hypothetical protein